MTNQLVKKKYLNDDFLLNNSTAKFLYHNCVKGLPVVDYHNHLNPVHLAENKPYRNIAQLWIVTDPYKHRAMRICGIPENLITGNAPDKDKFLTWARIFMETIGNPVFHWSILELYRVFGIEELLNEDNAEEIWERCNKLISEESIAPMDILRKWNAELICTSDDFLDCIEPHKKASDANDRVTIKPSLRADSIFNIEHSNFLNNILKLGNLTGINISDLESYTYALSQRLDYFNKGGCLLADKALDAGFAFHMIDDSEARELFKRRVSGYPLSKEDSIKLKSWLLVFLGKEYALRGWIMQLHIGAQRATSSRLRSLAGPNGGYASIGTGCDIESLCNFLDTLEKDGCLPKTILYTLNPNDNYAFTSITGSFVGEGVRGKVQIGPPWWYNDHSYGIKEHLLILANYGILNQFIGMTTDSRNVLSFSRHEYFRRVLCNQIGEWVEAGELPLNVDSLEKLAKNISYYNIKNWLTRE